MTTTSIRRCVARPMRLRREGFTLVELMVALGISTFAIIAMFSAFLVFVRGSLSVTNYSEMSAQSRKTLEIFARDVRMAESISVTGAQSRDGGSIVFTDDSITLSYPSAVSIAPVTYTFTGDTFEREQSGVTDDVLVGVRNMEIRFYESPGATFTSTAGPVASVNNWTKSLQIEAELVRNVGKAAGQQVNTDYIISARFMKRN